MARRALTKARHGRHPSPAGSPVKRGKPPLPSRREWPFALLPPGIFPPRKNFPDFPPLALPSPDW